ncbi:MAG: HAMP domain-containing histidine kinase [Gemmatimonadetes bacterium]|nr:HAMP domain-containing histidine kinase [Gemmatimonadota bacterium]
MALTFRQRVFLGLVGLGTLPLAGALLVLALEIRGTGSAAGPARAALEEIAVTGRALIASIDTLVIGAPARAALRAHQESIARRTSLARRAELLSRVATGALGGFILALAAVVVVASLTLARKWSGYASAPIEELVRWVRRIEQRQPLPPTVPNGGPPEFDALRQALREMAAALETARARELERGRLEAFRETARHLAHEMRGPLSAARLALRQFGDAAAPTRTASAIEVLEQETARLDQLAREFAEFGKLPEGPAADIDVAELLDNVVAATVPSEVPLTRRVDSGLLVRGHYEPLRRAIQNLLKNAVEAGGGIDVRAWRAAGTVTIAVSDGGPGVPPELRERIFEPYFTTKAAGTGLGLALVRQTIAAHGGTVQVDATASGGGAQFVVTLPEVT